MSICKLCERERSATKYHTLSPEYKHAWYEKNRQRLLENDRLKAYGISPEQYQEMVDSQNGVCAICRQPESALNKRREIKQLSVDHCHETGTVRGLLCHGCNAAIGLLGESIDRINAAAMYLAHHQRP